MFKSIVSYRTKSVGTLVKSVSD